MNTVLYKGIRFELGDRIKWRPDLGLGSGRGTIIEFNLGVDQEYLMLLIKWDKPVEVAGEVLSEETVGAEDIEKLNVLEQLTTL